MVEENKLFVGAKSSVASYELPTGWLDTETGELYKEIELREITGEEEDMLASTRMSAGVKMNNLMTACIQKIGPHTDKSKIRSILDELVSNDRFFLVYKIREISLGPVYKFQTPCLHCQDNQLRMVDLSEVVIPGLLEPKKRIYEGTLPRSKSPYRWKVQDGRSEDFAQKLLEKNKDDILSTIIQQRVQEIDRQPVSLNLLKKLPLADRIFLRSEFTKIEGEVDDKIIVDCPKCGQTFEVTADVAKKEFFFPTVF